MGIVSSRSRRFIEHFPKKQTRKMRSVLCVLLFSPCLLLNCDGASVENIYRSYANKMFGGNPSCITITDVSSAYSAEGVATACSNLCNGDSTCGAFWLEASYPTFTCKTVKKTCNIVEKMVDAPQGVIFLVKA